MDKKKNVRVRIRLVRLTNDEDKKYVENNLGNLVKDTDLSKFIL